MSDNDKKYSRWYDKDEIVQKCAQTLEALPDSLKRQTSTFIMSKIIQKPPYENMVADEIFNLATGDDRKRRWYDFDEVVRIFFELLRHSDDKTKRQIAIEAIAFIEDMQNKQPATVEIPDPDANNEYWFLKEPPTE